MKPLVIGIPIDLATPSRTPSTGINCSPATTAVTPTSPTSTAATSPLHHWCFRRIAVFSSPRGFRLDPAPGEPGRQTCPVTDTSRTVTYCTLLCAFGTERPSSPAAGSRSEVRAEAGGGQVQCLVRLGVLRQ